MLVSEVINKLNSGSSMRSVSNELGSSNANQIKTILEKKLEYMKDENGQWVYMGNGIESDVLEQEFPFKPYSKVKEIMEMKEVAKQQEDIQTAPEAIADDLSVFTDNEIQTLKEIVKRYSEGKEGQTELSIYEQLRQLEVLTNDERKKITPAISSKSYETLNNMSAQLKITKDNLIEIAVQNLFKMYFNDNNKK